MIWGATYRGLLLPKERALGGLLAFTPIVNYDDCGRKHIMPGRGPPDTAVLETFIIYSFIYLVI